MEPKRSRRENMSAFSNSHALITKTSIQLPFSKWQNQRWWPQWDCEPVVSAGLLKSTAQTSRCTHLIVAKPLVTISSSYSSFQSKVLKKERIISNVTIWNPRNLWKAYFGPGNMYKPDSVFAGLINISVFF